MVQVLYWQISVDFAVSLVCWFRRSACQAEQLLLDNPPATVRLTGPPLLGFSLPYG
jgi:hypothetical protein